MDKTRLTKKLVTVLTDMVERELDAEVAFLSKEKVYKDIIESFIRRTKNLSNAIKENNIEDAKSEGQLEVLKYIIIDLESELSAVEE